MALYISSIQEKGQYTDMFENCPSEISADNRELSVQGKVSYDNNRVC